MESSKRDHDMATHESENVPFIKRETLSSDSSHDEQPYTPSHPARKSWRSTLLISTSAFLLGLFTMGLVSYASSPAPSTSPPNRSFPPIRSGSDETTGLPKSWSHGDCGNSPSEAKLLGCRFDIILHSWLPADCITPEDDADAVLMYAGRNWEWRLGNGTEVTLDDVRTGEFAFVHTSFDWHVTHCMYVWKRMHRVMMDSGRRVDSYTINYHHTTHCAEMIGGGETGDGMKDAGSKIFVKYPVCS